MYRFVVTLASLVIVVSVSFSQTVGNKTFLEEYLTAYNNHNIEKTAGYISPEIKWFTVTDDSVYLELSGREPLIKWLAEYFQQIPSVKSEIIEPVGLGNYISFIENVSWKSADGSRSQKALAVYEIKNKLITRVWYYPSE